ncbi:putative protease sohB [Salmonella enterica subsp. arizonae]|uniref:Putative protease sohB n=1 Tax=Salmonella enterica subsp. arizonae TaxID=59203 RepID=A0A379TBQ3_SALER|nr:putative protease sohB [Salmonella enterica subsp. arizonae]
MLSEYGLFLAKIVTVVVAIAVIVLLIVNATQRKRQRGELRVTNLSEQYQEMKDDLAAALMDGHQQKLWHKAQKKKHKQGGESRQSESEAGRYRDSG